VLAWQRGFNPFGRPAPRIRPDFIVMSGSDTTAVLDARYRDLASFAPARDMTYQLALYAATRPGWKEAVILCPALRDEPEQRITIRPVGGTGDQAMIALRALNLERLARSIRDRDSDDAKNYCASLVDAVRT
jgi:5-methylcytosine-specific restriction enzyme subunit McrC